MDWFLEAFAGYLIYLIRYLTLMIKALGSRKWLVIKATVTGSSCSATYRGAVAEVTYTYTHKDEYFSGMHREPCILSGSAEEYVARFPAGGDVIVRVNPGDPEVSLVRDDDQAIGILVLR